MSVAHNTQMILVKAYVERSVNKHTYRVLDKAILKKMANCIVLMVSDACLRDMHNIMSKCTVAQVAITHTQGYWVAESAVNLSVHAYIFVTSVKLPRDMHELTVCPTMQNHPGSSPARPAHPAPHCPPVCPRGTHSRGTA